MFEKCISGEKIPEDRKLHTPITHTHGRKDECSNYRGISDTNTFSWLYGLIIKFFLENEYKGKEAEDIYI